MRDHAAVDPLTVPTVPKLLPPLPRIAPKKVTLDQACFQWSSLNEQNQPEKAMVCLANMQPEDAGARRNPLSGLYINYLYGKAACDDYISDSQKGIRYPIEKSGLNAQIDIGGTVDVVKDSASNAVSTASNLASDYSASWKNGDQTRFLKKYFSAAKNGNGLGLAKDSIENMMNVWNNSD